MVAGAGGDGTKGSQDEEADSAATGVPAEEAPDLEEAMDRQPSIASLTAEMAQQQARIAELCVLVRRLREVVVLGAADDGTLLSARSSASALPGATAGPALGEEGREEELEGEAGEELREARARHAEVSAELRAQASRCEEEATELRTAVQRLAAEEQTLRVHLHEAEEELLERQRTRDRACDATRVHAVLSAWGEPDAASTATVADVFRLTDGDADGRLSLAGDEVRCFVEGLFKALGLGLPPWQERVWYDLYRSADLDGEVLLDLEGATGFAHCCLQAALNLLEGPCLRAELRALQDQPQAAQAAPQQQPPPATTTPRAPVQEPSAQPPSARQAHPQSPAQSYRAPGASPQEQRPGNGALSARLGRTASKGAVPMQPQVLRRTSDGQGGGKKRPVSSLPLTPQQEQQRLQQQLLNVQQRQQLQQLQQAQLQQAQLQLVQHRQQQQLIQQLQTQVQQRMSHARALSPQTSPPASPLVGARGMLLNYSSPPGSFVAAQSRGSSPMSSSNAGSQAHLVQYGPPGQRAAVGTPPGRGSPVAATPGALSPNTPSLAAAATGRLRVHPALLAPVLQAKR